MRMGVSTSRKMLLAGASVFVLGAAPQAAWAQDDAQILDDDTQAVDDGVNEDVGKDNVIIVTASKREQTLQETPIAVSVTDAATIEQAQIRDLNDLQTVVPSLRVTTLQSSANTNFIIRGFGNGANNPGIEPSVGVFIDGVYRSRSAAQIGDLPNVQRIEVLRGPQSTLFGKNASAGVISIITQKPQFQFGGSVSATYGNFDTIVVKGDVTGPLTDTVAFALSGNINKRDGYARDLTLGIDINDRDRWGVRGQFLFEPSNDLEVRVIADYDKIDENCCIAANIVNGPTGAIIDAIAGGPGLGVVAEQPFSFEVRNNRPSSNDIENYGVSGQIDYSFGALSLTSITAYRELRAIQEQDSDFTAADLIGFNGQDLSIDTFTQELRLASDFGGPLNFLLGGYYFDETIDYTSSLLFGTGIRAFGNIASGGGLSALEGALRLPVGTFSQPGQGNVDNFDFTNTAYSIFGTVDFEVTDRLTLTAGFNYTDDEKEATSNVVTTDAFSAVDLVAVGFAQGLAGVSVNPNDPAAVAAFATANPGVFAAIQAGAQNPAVNTALQLRPLQFLPPFVDFPNAVEDGRTNDTDWSYTLRGSYEVSDFINVYATYATGFKASSFNLSRDSRPTNANFIPGSPVTNPPSSPIRDAGLAVPNLTAGTRFAGPEESEVYEIGIKGSFDRVAFNLALFDQTIEGFQSNAFTGTGFALTNAGEQSTRGFEFDGTVTPVDPLTIFLAVTYLNAKYDSFTGSTFGDLSGQRPAGIPDISMSVGASYTHEFDSGAEFILRGDYLYESEVQIVDGFVQLPQSVARDLTREVNLVNASATLKLINGFELSAYVRNLTNSRYLLSAFDTVAQAGSVNGYPNQPRTYGGTVRFKF